MNAPTPSRHERLGALLDRATDARRKAARDDRAEVREAARWLDACANDLAASLRNVELEQSALAAAVERLERTQAGA